jgi:hypothetical protein
MDQPSTWLAGEKKANSKKEELNKKGGQGLACHLR